jgi:formiminotetrahydrofolate cyclodeaminase
MQAAVRAILLNVDANLPLIPDPGTISALKQERQDLEAESNIREEAIARAYQARVDAANDLRSASAP